MKLLINAPIAWTCALDDDPSRRQAQTEMIQSVQDTLTKFSVYCQADVSGQKTVLRILAQKVTLADEDMNELFHDALDVLFEFRLRYVALGGQGCTFAVELADPTQRTSKP